MNIMNKYSDDFKSDLKEDHYGYYVDNKVFVTSDNIIKKNILNEIYNDRAIEQVIDLDNTFFIFDEIDSLINPLKSDLNIPNSTTIHTKFKDIYEKSIIKYKNYRENIINLNEKCNTNILEITNYSNKNIQNQKHNQKQNQKQISSKKNNININNDTTLNNKIDNIIDKLQVLKYNKDYGFGDYIDCYDEENNIPL